MNTFEAIRVLLRGKPKPPDLSWHWEVDVQRDARDWYMGRVWRVSDDVHHMSHTTYSRNAGTARDCAWLWIMEQPRT